MQTALQRNLTFNKTDKSIRIINTFGNSQIIKDNIHIKIDGEIIPFTYKYRFKKKGNVQQNIIF